MPEFFRIIKTSLIGRSINEDNLLVIEGISEKTQHVGHSTILYVLHTTLSREFKEFESFSEAIQYKKLLPNNGNEYTIV